jgi:hypothetical protein
MYNSFPPGHLIANRLNAISLKSIGGQEHDKILKLREFWLHLSTFAPRRAHEAYAAFLPVV